MYLKFATNRNMTRVYFTSLLFFSVIGSSYAQQESKPVRTSLNIFYSNKIVYQGALIWDAPFMGIIPSFVFYDMVSIGTGGLSVFKKINEIHTISLGASYFNDNKPGIPIIRLKNGEEDFKNTRGSTYGAYLKYDLKLKPILNLSLLYQKDLKRHHGNYYNGKISTSIIPLLTLGAGAGIGDIRNNQYAYGPTAIKGVGYVEGFASLMLPFLPWHGRLMLNYSYSKITQDENRNADYIRGKDSNNIFNSTASWSF